MEELKTLLEGFDVAYVEPYKEVWMKAKLNKAEDLLSVIEALIEAGVKSCSTVSPTDFLAEERMEINYFLEDVQNRRNVWLKVDIPRELEQCKIASITPLMPSANWHELEAYSTFGVTFEGHPNLRYFLISNDYYGVFPFRKDFDHYAHEKKLVENVNAITQEYFDEYEEHEQNKGHEGSQTVLNWGPTHPASGPLRLRV